MELNKSNCWLVSEYSIENDEKDLPSSAEKRFSKQGKALKNAFKLGVSKSVKSKGKVIDDPKQSEEESGDAQNKDKEASSDQNQSQSPDQSAGGETSSSTETSKESYQYKYSILEAFSNLRHLYNEESEESAAQSTGEPSDSGANGDEGDATKVDHQEKGEDEEPKKNSFQFGSSYSFWVKLPDEGFTEWHVHFDKRANREAAIKAIKSKNLKAALDIASKGVGTDGLVPVYCATYIVKKPKLAPAFMGHCRYGFDCGSEDSDTEDNLNVCLAVAPIDGVTNKPNENCVISATYNIIGDITGGKIGELAAALNKKADDYAQGEKSYDSGDEEDNEKNQADKISEFLHKAFKCTGDQSMYAQFNQIKKFIDDNLKDGNLEFVEADSTNIDKTFVTKQGKLKLLWF